MSYSFLFKFILIGDTGNNLLNISKVLESHVFYYNLLIRDLDKNMKSQLV